MNVTSVWNQNHVASCSLTGVDMYVITHTNMYVTMYDNMYVNMYNVNIPS